MKEGDRQQHRRASSSHPHHQVSPERPRSRHSSLSHWPLSRGGGGHDYGSPMSGPLSTGGSARRGSGLQAFFSPTSSGGLSMTQSRSGSVLSPLRYNSPTKKFGYMRWPPLISPTSEVWSQGYDDDYADVRLEVESVGHNLTSVMMNPRDPFMSELDPGGADVPSSVVPVHLPVTSMADITDLVRRTGRAHDRYRQNHHSAPPAPLLQRRDLPTPSTRDQASDLAECFRQVPSIFFSRDFHLDDPALFERLVVAAAPDAQERLTQYLDSVESCLLRQISSRSKEFFDALTTLQDVRERVSQACSYVHRLRSGLHDIDRKTVMGMIRIPRLAQRKVNMSSLVEKLKLMQDVQRSKELVQSLLASEDYMAALDVLEDARSVMTDCLSGVQCLRKLERQLAEYLELVTDLMGSSFINLALQIHGEEEEEEHEDGGHGSSDQPSKPPVRAGGEGGAAAGLSASTAAQLTPRIRGLVRLCRLSKVLEKYRTRLTDTLKVIVKTVVLEYLDMGEYQGPDDSTDVSGSGAGGERGSEVEESSRLSARVRAMEPGAFLECLQLCFEQLLLPMQRVSVMHAFLEEQMDLELMRLIEKHKVEEERRSPGKGLSGGAGGEQAAGQAATSQGGEGEEAGNRRFVYMNGSSGEGQQAAEGEASGPPPQVRSPVKGMGGGAAVPPPAPPPPATPSGGKFRAFLDKRRFDTTIAPAARAYREEDQIKVLELQACKRLNEEILKSLCDLCQRHVSSLLVIRREAHVKLSLGEMKTLWDATFGFVTAIEKISGSGGFGLKSTLLTQAKLFVEHTHESFMASLVSALESEKWSQADVSPERQAELDRLTAGKAILPKTTATATAADGGQAVRRSSSLGMGRLPSGDGAEEVLSGGGAGIEGASSKRPKKKEPTEALVEDTRFKVVWSVLLLVEMVLSYLNLAANFPVLCVDVVQRVVDLFRFFNTRTTQLVLGAGAINSAARLRSITAKHLALASQCLALVMVLLPHVRAALSAHLQPKQQAFLAELDRIKQEYSDHHEKILAKFVSIIGELIANSAASSLQETEWDNMGSTSCRFIEDVIKGVTTMHKVLHQHLPPAQIQDVFSRIFDLLTHRLREYFEDVKPATTAGRQRLVDEISHLVTSLSMLRGVNAEALKLDEFMRQKYNVL